MRLYTLIPRISGYISDWISLVPHISKMGFDTIHILPFTRMGSSLSPYSSTNPYVIDERFHPDAAPDAALEDFKKFVETLKKYRMKLCLDIVLNHLSTENPILQKNPEWYVKDNTEADGMKRAGWSDGTNWHKWNDLALLNYEHTVAGPLWDYMLHYILFWAEFAAKTNGYIRLDNLHSSYPDFVEYALAQVRRKYPSIRYFSELFSDEHSMIQIIQVNHIDFLQGTPWEHKFITDIRNYLQYIHSDIMPVRYLCSVLTHDSGSIIEEYGSIDSLAPRLAISALLSSGDWGIVQGTEYAPQEKAEFIGQTSARPFLESLSHTTDKYKNLIEKLNYAIVEYPCFREKGNLILLHQEQQEILSAIRIHSEQSALVCINLDTHNTHTITIEESLLLEHNIHASKLYDILSTKNVDSTINELTHRNVFIINLEPCEIFVCVIPPKTN